VNEILTAYLYGLYSLRGGRFSAADAMNHIIDMLSGAQRAKSGFDRLVELVRWRRSGAGEGGAPQAKGEAHA
jgi:hypothetical protein